MLNVLKKANTLGWELVSSTDVSSKCLQPGDGGDSVSGLGYKMDVHTWYFVYKHQPTGRFITEVQAGAELCQAKHSLS